MIKTAIQTTGTRKSCGNRDNPPQISPIIIHIALLGIYSIPSIKNGIANIPIIKIHPPFAINDNFFVSILSKLFELEEF